MTIWYSTSSSLEFSIPSCRATCGVAFCGGCAVYTSVAGSKIVHVLSRGLGSKKWICRDWQEINMEEGEWQASMPLNGSSAAVEEMTNEVFEIHGVQKKATLPQS